MEGKTTLADVDATGAFRRKDAVFRNKISSNGPYPPEGNRRYLLYVSYACPWASRCLAFRELKGLTNAIGLVVVSPVWQKTRPTVDDHEGWVFDPSYPGATAEPHGFLTVRDLYDHSMRTSNQEGLVTRYTVPLLFDTVTSTIVNNESSEIIRFFNNEFNAVAEFPDVDLAPEALLPSIDAMNEKMYESVCNGVYKCGFAQSQEAYNQAITSLFSTLAELDALLATQRFLVSHTTPTESDIRLFVTLVRFDEVYVVHFKCNQRTIRDHQHLREWMRDVYQTLRLEPTVKMDHIKDHYYKSHKGLNRFGIVPAGPRVMEDLAVKPTRVFQQQ